MVDVECVDDKNNIIKGQLPSTSLNYIKNRKVGDEVYWVIPTKGGQNERNRLY